MVSALLGLTACGSTVAQQPADGGHRGDGSHSRHTTGPDTVPLTDVRAVVDWQLVIDGTPAQKRLAGARAERLAREFDALRPDNRKGYTCPMIPSQQGDIHVTFRAQGHTWYVTVPACPNVRVLYDGKPLHPVRFGKDFLADVKRYTGYLPSVGPPQRAPGGVVPLHQSAQHR